MLYKILHDVVSIPSAPLNRMEACSNLRFRTEISSQTDIFKHSFTLNYETVYPGKDIIDSTSFESFYSNSVLADYFTCVCSTHMDNNNDNAVYNSNFLFQYMLVCLIAIIKILVSLRPTVSLFCYHSLTLPFPIHLLVVMVSHWMMCIVVLLHVHADSDFALIADSVSCR